MSVVESIQPVVLVGGRSRRFGRDKLIESIGRVGSGGRVLVDHPIGVLRDVFGPRVAVVGRCDDRVRARADAVLADPYPGTGPIGGVLAALEGSGSAVFVLAGDLPAITPGSVRRIMACAADSPGALAVLARSDRIEPCIGLYRERIVPSLVAAMAQQPQPALHAVLSAAKVELVPVDPAEARNVNRPSDLP